MAVALFLATLVGAWCCQFRETQPASPQDLGGLARKADTAFGPLDDLLVLNGRRIESPRAWRDKRAQLRRTILQYLGSFPETTVPLDPRVLSREVLQGYTRLKVEYRTLGDDAVRAWLLVPESPESGRRVRFSAIIAMHQTVPEGKDEPVGLSGSPNMHYALDLVHRGYVVLAPDSITAGERVDSGARPFETRLFDQQNPNWSAIGKMIWDHRRGIDYLETLPFVDRTRIGAVGHSLGAYNAFFLAAFDERIQIVIESCGYTTIAADPGRERWARVRGFVHIPRLRPFVEPGSVQKPPFDFQEVLALVAPRPLFQSAGLADHIFPSTETVAQVHVELHSLYALLGAPDRLETHVFDGPHDFPPPARTAAWDFLDRWLRRRAG